MGSLFGDFGVVFFWFWCFVLWGVFFVCFVLGQGFFLFVLVWFFFWFRVFGLEFFVWFLFVLFVFLGFFPHVLVSNCAENVRSNALLCFCLRLWGETDGSRIRNTSESVLSFLRLLCHSAHRVSRLELLTKMLLVS